MTTKDRVAFSYGLVEARIRLPRGRGVWPAPPIAGVAATDGIDRSRRLVYTPPLSPA